MAYFYLKALHIIGFVSWFAGLFYLVRLFIYHVEANKKPESERKILQAQFELMQQRLDGIIATPAMIFTFLCGFGMIYINPAVFTAWLHIKLLLLFGLVLYHMQCKRIMKRLANGTNKSTAYQYRLFNEVATLFLVAIVLIAVLKDSLQFLTAFLILFAVGAALFIGIRWYRKIRMASK